MANSPRSHFLKTGNTSFTRAYESAYAIILVRLLLIFFVAATVHAETSPSPDPPYERISANPGKHFIYPYYILVPPELRINGAKGELHTILVLPNNTGKISDDFQVHEDDVKKRMTQAAAVASFLKVAAAAGRNLDVPAQIPVNSEAEYYLLNPS